MMCVGQGLIVLAEKSTVATEAMRSVAVLLLMLNQYVRNHFAVAWVPTKSLILSYKTTFAVRYQHLVPKLRW